MPNLLRRALVRLAETLLVLWAVVTLTFLMAHAVPGGPFDAERPVSAEAKKAMMAHYGLNRSLPVQYLHYLGNFARGDLGESTQSPGWTVRELVALKLPVSVELGVWGLLVALVLGLGAGIVAAARPRTWSDYLPTGAALAGLCLPTFVIGPLLLLLFGLRLHWVNIYGWQYPYDRVLPALTLGLYYAAYLARLTRAGLVEARQQDYVRTARAKGCGPTRVLLVHALRNALGPVVAYLGPAVAGLLSGSFVVETIFQVPGLGRAFVESALNSDYDMVLGVTVLLAGLVLACNWLADILLALLNPRVRDE